MSTLLVAANCSSAHKPMVKSRDERVHHYLYLYLFNHLNYLYPEWAGSNPEVGVVWLEMGVA